MSDSIDPGQFVKWEGPPLERPALRPWEMFMAGLATQPGRWGVFPGRYKTQQGAKNSGKRRNFDHPNYEFVARNDRVYGRCLRVEDSE